jgi:hypothetical protein
VEGASTLYVNGATGDDKNSGISPLEPKKTIQNAINAVNSKGTVKVADGTYEEDLYIAKNVNLVGNNPRKTIIDGNNQKRPVTIKKGSVSLEKFTITKGLAENGGGIYNLGDLIINNCNIVRNNVPDFQDGGGILNIGSLKIINSNISFNKASLGSGGAISNPFGTLNIVNCNLSYNKGIKGGAIYNSADLLVSYSHLTKNTGFMGGGVYNDEIGKVTVNQSDINYNECPENMGGGIHNNGTFLLNTSNINYNKSCMGGGILNGGDMILKGCNIFHNSVNNEGLEIHNGGGINNFAGTMTIENCHLSGNTAFKSDGGGISNGGQLFINNSQISKNYAGSCGGAIMNNGTTTITNSRISENIADGGGGICQIANKMTITNCTLIGNKANYGGGINNGIGELVANFNRIIDNIPNAIIIYLGIIDVKFNWWGSNNPDFNLLIKGKAQYKPWLIMRLTSNPINIPQGSTSIITTDFRYDSENIYHDPSYGHLPDNTKIFLSSTSGILAKNNIYTLNGMAMTIFMTNGVTGKTLVTGQLDEQEMTAYVNVTNASSNNIIVTPTKHITMKNTGISLILALLSICFLLGGIVSILRD